VLSVKDFNIERAISCLILIQKNILPTYKMALEDHICSIVGDKKERISLRQSVGFYCSHLVNLGYSKAYIGRKVDDVFFSDDVKRAGKSLLKRFFKNFKGRRTKFLVYTLVDRPLKRIIDQMSIGEFIKNDGISAKFGVAVSKHDGRLDNTSLLLSPIDAFDEFSAVASVQTFLNSVRALTYLAPKGLPCRWHPDMYVSRRNKSGGFFRNDEVSFETLSENSGNIGRVVKGIKSYSMKIFEAFDSNSVERIISAVNTSALARISSNLENQLISLWSAIEVLLSEPPRNQPRILHYANLIVSCICRSHIRRQMQAVYEQLLLAFGGNFRHLLRSSGEAESRMRLPAVLFLPEHKDLQEQLFKMCAGSPLALHRLWKLHKDYASPEDVKKTAQAHENRVEWQIHRIYRARNQLVHAGYVPSYLDSLVMNLAEYYRSAIFALVGRATRDSDESDIDQVVAEVGIEYRVFLENFRGRSKENSITRTDLALLF
jgi:hypothetical protein